MAPAHAHQGGGQEQTSGYVVAVTHKGQFQALKSSLFLINGEQVAQRLAWMFVVGESIDNRYSSVLGQQFEGLVGECSGYDAVHVAA